MEKNENGEIPKVAVTVLVPEAQKLPSVKGEFPSCFLRMKFPGVEESSESTLIKDTADPQFGFSKTFDVEMTQPILNRMINEPVVFTIVQECESQKDKKSKDKGPSHVDIAQLSLPLNGLCLGEEDDYGDIRISEWMEMTTLEKPKAEPKDEPKVSSRKDKKDKKDKKEKKEEKEKAEEKEEKEAERMMSPDNIEPTLLFVDISIPQPFDFTLMEDRPTPPKFMEGDKLPKSLANEVPNILNVDFTTLHNIPSKWLMEDHEKEKEYGFSYVLDIQIPQHGGFDKLLCVGNMVKPDASQASSPEPVSEDDIDAKESTQQSVAINFRGKYFLGSQTVHTLLLQDNMISMDLRRVPKSDLKGGVNDVDMSKPHGSIVIPITDLLNIDVKTLHGRFPVSACIDPHADLTTPASGMEESVGTKTPVQAEEKEKDKDKKKHDKKSKKDKKTDKKKDKKEDIKKEPAVEEVNPLIGADMYLKATLELAKPFYLRCPTPKARVKPADLIPPRKPMPKMDQSQAAAEDFDTQLQQIAQALSAEFDALLPPETTANLSTEEMREKILFHLNVSGNYYVFKEKLKRSVVRIVREMFRRTEPFSEEPLHTFCNDLYVKLMNMMQESLNKAFNPPAELAVLSDVKTGKPLIAASDRSKNQLLLLAKDADIIGNHDLATTLHEEVLAMNESDAEAWHAYALHCLRLKDKSRAEECLRQAISCDSKYINSLLLYGALLSERGQHDDAATFVQEVTECEPNNPLAWALLALLHDAADNEKMYRRTVAQASKIHSEKLEGDDRVKTPATPLSKHRNSQDRRLSGNVLTEIALFLLDCGATILAERALVLNQEAIQGVDPNISLANGRLYILKEDYRRAEENLQDVLGNDHHNTTAWALLGQVHFHQGRDEDSINAFDSALGLPGGCGEETRVSQLLLAMLHMRHGQYMDAREAYISAVTECPTALAWLGVGKACIALEEFGDAEDALAEANILDNHDSSIWANLAILCLHTKRLEEADQAMKEALRLQISDAVVLTELAQLYNGLGRHTIAERCLVTALEFQSDYTVARRHLADALTLQGKWSEAAEQCVVLLNLPSHQVAEDDLKFAQKQLDIFKADGVEIPNVDINQYLAAQGKDEALPSPERSKSPALERAEQEKIQAHQSLE